MFRILILMFVAVALSGCLGQLMRVRPQQPSVQPQVRTERPDIQVISKKINRKKYTRLLNSGSLNNVRLIETFGPGSDGNVKQYRIFDIKPGSVYDLLGLKHVDIIVLASGYSIPSQEVFWKYLVLLQKQQKGDLEIRRGGRSVLLEYEFID